MEPCLSAPMRSGSPPIWMSADLVILGHTLPGVVHAMVVKPEIKRAEDLKGKKIGVTTFGSLTDFLIQYALRKKGLNPNRDVAPERSALITVGVATGEN